VLAALTLLVGTPGTATAVRAVRVDAHHADGIGLPSVVLTDARHAALVIHTGGCPLIVQPATAAESRSDPAHPELRDERIVVVRHDTYHCLRGDP
jgi:hypothetical protein